MTADGLHLPAIAPVDAASIEAARARLDRLTKPPGSLGRVEDLAAWLAGVQAKPIPSIEKRAVVVAAADHGVAARGVSAYPPEVTAQMVMNFCAGGAAINVLAREAGADVFVVDAGVKTELPPREGLLSRRAGPGTADFAAGPAMTREQAAYCISAGLEIATMLDADVVACGEMGIGNTTAASAVTAAFTGAPVAAVTGRGTGKDAAGVEQKVAVIETALRVNRPAAGDALDVLTKVGGFEIGLLAGVMVGTAARRRAVVLDGFISGAAALIASGLAPKALPYMVASHRSAEPGHAVVLQHLGLEPLFELQLRLGEGTGAALALPLLDAACAILSRMATFEEANVSDKQDA